MQSVLNYPKLRAVWIALIIDPASALPLPKMSFAVSLSQLVLINGVFSETCTPWFFWWSILKGIKP